MKPIDYCEFAPPRSLERYVRCFWTLSAPAGVPCVEPIVPDGCMELVVHFGDRFASIAANGTSVLQERAVFVGQIRAPFCVVPTGEVGVVSARFRIGGAAPWLRGRSAGALTGMQLPVDEIWGRDAVELTERLALACDAQTRVDVLSQWLERRMRVDAEHPAVSRAADWFERPRGSRGVDALSAHLGLGPRQLQRLFAEHVGLSPKTMGRIVRLQSFLSAARATPDASGAELALRSGYADQAHLIRDFREFAGTTPRAWLAAHTPIVGALAGF
jgi:AraC-like DNA-binding protein